MYRRIRIMNKIESSKFEKLKAEYPKLTLMEVIKWPHEDEIYAKDEEVIVCGSETIGSIKWPLNILRNNCNTLYVTLM